MADESNWTTLVLKSLASGLVVGTALGAALGYLFFVVLGVGE